MGFMLSSILSPAIGSTIIQVPSGFRVSLTWAAAPVRNSLATTSIQAQSMQLVPMRASTMFLTLKCGF
jgi:hypothetical protein